MHALAPLSTLLAALLSAPALAHDGHGLSGSHWHASDSFGWIAAALAVAVGVWIARR